MRVTRNDVAKMAGVSAATVSYVLNNSRKFSDETVKRVMDAVQKLGYKPDNIARSMAKNNTHQLAVVIDSILNPYYGEIVLGFENTAIKNGYFVNICSGSNNLDSYFDNFISRRIDGILVLALPDKYHSSKLYDLVDAGIKIVSGGIEDIDLKRISLLDNNYGQGMILALEHLYSLGHRDIAYLSSLTGYEKSDARYKSFIDWMKEHEVNYPEKNVFTSHSPYNVHIQGGLHLAQKMMNSGKKFTAVVCTNDLIAIGAIKAFTSAGLKVPEDISVVGFDNVMYGEYWTPSITSVTYDKQAFGQKACEVLLNNIRSDVTGFYRANVSMYIGDSTAPAKDI